MATPEPARLPRAAPERAPTPTPDLAADATGAQHRARGSALAATGARCDAVDGTVSVARAPVPPARSELRPYWQREPAARHYAASTMKVAVMAAVVRAAEDGELDLDDTVRVHDDFESVVPGAGTYRCSADYDSDPAVWQRLGSEARLGWLVLRSIVRSSNLATNLLLERLGFTVIDDVYRLVDATGCTLNRMIEDAAGLAAGVSNDVTALGLARLLGAIAAGSVASPQGCAWMLGILGDQEIRDDIDHGLPPGTKVAHKNGWVEGVRHSMALVEPGDCPAYLLAICTTSTLDKADAGRLLADIAAASWADRFDVTSA